MHADEDLTDASLVRRLLEAQFPQWAGLPIERVAASGTDNVTYRIGDELAARLPRRSHDVGRLEKELRWLPVLAPLPLAIPVPVATGEPGAGYSFAWAVYRWLEGVPLADEPIDDLAQAAVDVAAFIRALWTLDASDGPPPGAHNANRGVSLGARDTTTRAAIVALGTTIDADAVTAAWARALEAPEWTRGPVWIHGDLDARNLLADRGRISAVIDFGCLGVGDPACDVMVAWKVLTPQTRELFRDALQVDDPTWERARGWALSQSLIALSYYTPESNPVLVREAARWMAAVLE